ncbi:hypothetical protein FQN60_002854, partial [Etheostoma spectabile]
EFWLKQLCVRAIENYSLRTKLTQNRHKLKHSKCCIWGCLSAGFSSGILWSKNVSMCAKWSLSSDANSAFVFPRLPPQLRNVLFSEELRVHL